MTTSRRTFVKLGAIGAGALVIAFAVPMAPRLWRRLRGGGEPAPLDPNAFLTIGPDDVVTIQLAHSEMGQGVWTALPMLVAEELDADWSRIRVEHAPAAPAYTHTAAGMQMTGGSSSVSSEWDRYRRVGAMARALLLQAAATRLGVAVGELRTENGEVIAGDRRLRYGELAADAAALEAPEVVTLKPREQWRLIGKPTRRIDSPEKVTGRATFGYDVRFEGLRTALVAHPPVFGAKVRAVRDAAALAVPGVRKVVQVPSGVAVVADHFWAARQGRDALEVEWDMDGVARADSAALRAEYERLVGTPGRAHTQRGDLAAARGGAAGSLEATYHVPYLAHAMMEPLSCTVRITGDGCEITTGTQFQSHDQSMAASILGIPAERVTLRTTFLGGGFGRRATATSDIVTEAVHVAKAAGEPVKTVWTREDDIRGGYYRPMYVNRARIDVDAEGMPVAWQQVVAGQSLVTGTPFQGPDPDAIDGSTVEGIADSAYLSKVANVSVEVHQPKVNVPVLWWRSVGHSQNAFIMESLVDELAARVKADPVAYRRALLAGHERHLRVLELAVERSGWGTPLPAGRARGIAVHESFGSVVAQVAEVSVEGGRIRVHRVTCAVDCGTAVNPLTVEAQMQSGIAYGLGAALHGAVHLDDGRVRESNFHDYGVLRFAEMPQVEVHLVPSTEPPSGVGEPGTPPIAPAVANAVAALTGVRLRELPLRLPG